MSGDRHSIDDARAAKLIGRTRELVAAGAVDFSQPHCRQRMQERRISITQVLTVLRDGEPDQLPRLDGYDCWRLRFAAVIDGRRLRVVVALDADAAVVVTVI